MNKISYINQPPNNEPTIIFEDANGNEFSFKFPKDSSEALVSANNRNKNSSTTKPATLSIDWLRAFVTSSIEVLKDDGVALVRTPLGEYFELSKGDLKTLRDFIFKNAGNI